MEPGFIDGVIKSLDVWSYCKYEAESLWLKISAVTLPLCGLLSCSWSRVKNWLLHTWHIHGREARFLYTPTPTTETRFLLDMTFKRSADWRGSAVNTLNVVVFWSDHFAVSTDCRNYLYPDRWTWEDCFKIQIWTTENKQHGVVFFKS